MLSKMSRLIMINSDRGPELVPVKNNNPTYEKMSKSKKNGVTVDEALYVRELNDRYEFRTLPPHYILVDYKKVNIFKNSKDGFYYTTKYYDAIPVLLVNKYDDYIPRFGTEENPIMQHESKIDSIYKED